MATVHIVLEDEEDSINEGEESMSVRYRFDPTPATTDENEAEFITVAQDYGLFLVEQVLGRPLTGEDFSEPTVH